MRMIIVRLLCCLLILIAWQQGVTSVAAASEEEERIQLLQEKLTKLKQLLVKVQEEKIKEQPPTEIPWEPVLGFAEERPAYDQYAYLLAPQMRQETLDSLLQQLYHLAGLDELKERGNLFVIPALPLAAGEVMAVNKYNRDLAGQYLQTIGLPRSYEGLLIIAPEPLHRKEVAEDSLLVIDLTGADQILRSRIFEMLLQTRLFTADGSIQDYLWNLLQNASPQEFVVSVVGKQMWLAVAEN